MNLKKTVALALIERHLQFDNAIKKLEEIGISIQIVDNLIYNDFEIDLATSILYPDFMNEAGPEFLPSELSKICADVSETNIENKAEVILNIFNDVLEFFHSSFDHGILSKSDHKGTVYTNRDGDHLLLNTLYTKYGVK